LRIVRGPGRFEFKPDKFRREQPGRWDRTEGKVGWLGGTLAIPPAKPGFAGKDVFRQSVPREVATSPRATVGGQGTLDRRLLVSPWEDDADDGGRGERPRALLRDTGLYCREIGRRRWITVAISRGKKARRSWRARVGHFFSRFFSLKRKEKIEKFRAKPTTLARIVRCGNI